MTPFAHPYRIDAPTLARTAGAPGESLLTANAHMPSNIRLISIDPADFTHAYTLFGTKPQRFTEDLRFYLATVKTFFQATTTTQGISIPNGANADLLKRLAEDLGVALAAYFMVKVFGVTWDTISQIPVNTKLSAKRPDFQGFGPLDRRYLFESKGTTSPGYVEKALGDAIEQVKAYPEPADAKIAIVSYLSADDRFFPSSSFVVDPPALPESVLADEATSRLLHFEKMLQFAGLEDLAPGYLAALAAKLQDELRDRQEGVEGSVRIGSFDKRVRTFRRQLDAKKKAHGVARTQYDGEEFVGRDVRFTDPVATIFLGMASEAFEAGTTFRVPQREWETRIDWQPDHVVSRFTDGTLLRLSGLQQ